MSSAFSELLVEKFCKFWRKTWTEETDVDCSTLTDEQVGEILMRTYPVDEDDE